MPDDTTILGTAHIQSSRSGSLFQRATGRGATGNVSASLKFDIPGLKDFKSQLDAINKSLDQLNTTFAKLAKAPEAFSRSVENAVKQMKALQAAQVQGNRYVTQGVPPQRDPVGQATAAAQGAGAPPAGTGSMGGGGGGKGGLGEFTTKAITAMMQRFDAGMQQAISSDVYASRMASFQGSPSSGGAIFRNQGKNGFGFMATDMTQGNMVQYAGTGFGAYVGASGRAGQWGSAYQRSIKQMQEVMPGLDAEQAAGVQSSIYSNVQGIKMARALLGPSASPYKSDGTGERKTQGEYFRDILNGLQKLPRGNGQTGNWTKEEIMKQNFPGSRLNAWLASVLPDDAIPMWYEWAINNAAVGGNLSNDPNVAKKQLEGVRGRSLATNAQETSNRQAQKDATFAGEQYGAMNARMDYEKDMLGVLQHIDTMLSGIYGIFGRVPSLLQGPVAGGIGGLLNAISPISMISGLLGGGDPGYMPMGDPEGGLSHLTPDLRGRMQKMMAANPNIKVSSAYRDTRRQQSLQGKGPFAPAGKSEHGKGRAADLGPSSQLGWIAKNAKRFGLDAATQYGEPWHVQLAGTLGIGDPDPTASARRNEGALTSSIVSGIIAKWQSGSSTSGTTSSTGGGGAATVTSGDFTPGQGGTLSADQMVQLLYQAGFRGEDIVKMAGISNRESSWNPGAYNPDASTGDNSLGLWQINVLGNLAAARLPLIQAAGGSSINDLYNPLISAKVAYQMWQSSGYTPWGPYKGVSELNNVKQSALDEARAAAQAHGYLGDPGYASGTAGGDTNVSLGGGTHVTFQNVFQLSFPNGASKSSIDTAARQIATRLEPQVRRLVSRNT